MWHIQRIDPLRLLENVKYVSFVGGGGKSSLIECLGQRAAEKGRTVAATTTTKIYATEPYLLFRDVGEQEGEHFIRVGKTREGEKLTGLSSHELERLGERRDLVLIEADGAKHRPLKCPAFHEPVIPPFSDKVCVVAGLDALGGRVDHVVFRWELLAERTGLPGSTIISEEVFTTFFSKDILLKDVDTHKSTIILNKYDALHDRGAAIRLAKKIIQETGAADVVISSLFFRLFYRIAQIRAE